MFVLAMNFEVVYIPKHQVIATISVVVHFVNATLIPRRVLVSIDFVDSILLSEGTKFHWIGEHTICCLNEHPKAIGIRHYQIIAGIAIHVAGDVYMGDIAVGRHNHGRHRHQRVFYC